MAPATALSAQALTNVAKALIEAYNERDWAKAKAGLTPDFVYDEIATGRKLSGINDTIGAWQGWAQAFPDSKGSVHAAHVAEDGVVTLELTWSGTHQGPLPTPNGFIAPTGKVIEVRACAVVEVAGEKARGQRHYFDMATMLRQIGVMS